MLSRNSYRTKLQNNRPTLKNHAGLNFFYFDLSEKNHEIVLPVEKETAWEQIHEITWDPGRGD